jgi:molecular chaperone Hsp33
MNKKPKDYIVRATASDGAIRAFAAVTGDMVQKAHETHLTSPVASAALGRALTAAALMSQMLKNEKDTITLQIKGDGPLGGIVTVADSNANVRGYVYNPEVHVPLTPEGKFDVSAAVGKDGYLNIIKDLGLKEPYIGYVKLVSGEIGDDLAYYFASSEQVPSVVALGVLVNPDGSIQQAGGYIIQRLPDAGEEIVENLERKIANATPVTTLLSHGNSPEDILEILLGDLKLNIIDKIPCYYKCNCSRERMERNILTLGKAEIEDLIEKQHGAELQCHFCNTKYYFSEEELRQLIS